MTPNYKMEGSFRPSDGLFPLNSTRQSQGPCPESGAPKSWTPRMSPAVPASHNPQVSLSWQMVFRRGLSQPTNKLTSGGNTCLSSRASLQSSLMSVNTTSLSLSSILDLNSFLLCSGHHCLLIFKKYFRVPCPFVERPEASMLCLSNLISVRCRDATPDGL